MEKPKRVFVSHAALDRVFVEREIVSLLMANGINVWYSRQDVRTASQWQRSILDGLEQCDWFLVVLSPRSVDSRWVEAEVHWALDERPERVVPVLMEDCDWPRLHLMLRTIQHVDLRGNLEAAKRQLLQTWGVPSATHHDTKDTRKVTPATAVSPADRQSPAPQTHAAQPAALESAPATRRPRKKAVTVNRSGDVVENTIWMQLKLVPAGEFMMGASASEADALQRENPQHRVRITKPFYLGIYAVTQEEYEQVMGRNPSHFKGNDQRPVESVSWLDALIFCNKLSDQEGVGRYYKIDQQTVSINGGQGYRLPTEAEWEYACRAGTTTKWSCGDNANDLARAAWYGKAWSSGTHPVGEKEPSPWGLCDMHGNVWEWCWDWYGEYENAELADPSGSASGESRVLRGGSFDYAASLCRSSFRYFEHPDNRSSIRGFRISMTVA